MKVLIVFLCAVAMASASGFDLIKAKQGITFARQVAQAIGDRFGDDGITLRKLLTQFIDDVDRAISRPGNLAVAANQAAVLAPQIAHFITDRLPILKPLNTVFDRVGFQLGPKGDLKQTFEVLNAVYNPIGTIIDLFSARKPFRGGQGPGWENGVVFYQTH